MVRRVTSKLKVAAVLLAIGLSACSHTYPEDRLVNDLRVLCFREYGIEDVDVKISGKTIGVHLPLQKLFSTDFSKLLANGKDIQNVQNLEGLLQFSPEAMERVENVLFSISRVILSTDKDIDFYVLTATDTELTGIQLVLAGYVGDLKRVRFWDISRDEYRKRIANDLRINRGVIWKKPVERLFKDLGVLSTDQLIEKHFLPDRTAEEISPLFYSELLELAFKKDVRYEILEIRSTSMKQGEVAVYAKVRSTFRPMLEYVNYDFLIPSGYEAEYIFILVPHDQDYRIQRVIPFHFLDEKDKMERVEFPEELGLYRNMDGWLEDFGVEEIHLPEFLAQQITRRVQQILHDDPRIMKSFENVRVEFSHIKEEATPDLSKKVDATGAQHPLASGQTVSNVGHFRLTTLITPKISTKVKASKNKNLFSREDVQYVLDKALREFVSVLRSYRFEDFQYLDIISPADNEILVLEKQDLELYRQKKIPLVQLLNTTYPM